SAIIRAQEADVREMKSGLRVAVVQGGSAAQRPSPLINQSDRLLAHVPEPFIGPRPRGVRNGEKGQKGQVVHPTSESSFNAVTKVNTFGATAVVRKTIEELAPMMDPRAWALGGGVVAKVYRVEVDKNNGEYQPVPAEKNQTPLGQPWTGFKRPWLL